MSVNYASGLSDYEHKGKLDLKEIFDLPEIFDQKIKELIELIKESKHLVVHTGAGISTSTGIPDFRGPRGVWTLEMKGERPEFNTSFEDAVPSKTHMALVMLERQGILKYIVSQNVDGLHLKSGFPREKLSELHGNMFMEKCEKCNCVYMTDMPVSTMALKRTGNLCNKKGRRGTMCRGKLRDTVLDWEDALPYDDIIRAEEHSKYLSQYLGSTLGLKFYEVKRLKPEDKKASLVIHGYVDTIMEKLVEGLGLSIPEYDPKVYLSLVTIFSKRKLEGEEIDSKYGHIKSRGHATDSKRPKVEDNLELTAEVSGEKSESCAAVVKKEESA